MKAVFLDRDGTLNVNTGYVGDPARVALVAKAAEGARMLSGAGFALVVTSNQSGIARGYFSEADADAVDRRVRELLAEDGVSIAAMYRCPHLPADLVAPADACDCRKPKPGLLLRAARELGIDLAASWMVGDRLLDMQAAAAAGCRGVTVPGVPPHEPAEDFSSAPPAYRACDLVDAARFIIAQSAPGANAARSSRAEAQA